MELTVQTWANLHMTHKLTLNNSSRKIGKFRWQTKKIELTILKMNVTYYLVF